MPNVNVQFGRSIKPVSVKDVSQNKIQILYNRLSESAWSANITVGAEPVVIKAFGLLVNQKITVYNVFNNTREKMYYNGGDFVLTNINNVIVLAVSGVYVLNTPDILGEIVCISYPISAMDPKAKNSVDITNPNGPQNHQPNVFFSGGAGQEYSQDVFVGSTPLVFRGYGITTQLIELYTVFDNEVFGVEELMQVYEAGVGVKLDSAHSTMIVSIAGRYRFKIVGNSENIFIVSNPTPLNYTDPFLKRGEPGADGASGAGVNFTQFVASDEWTITHNLGYYPSVELMTVGGVEFEANVIHMSLNETKVYLTSAIAGSARLA